MLKINKFAYYKVFDPSISGITWVDVVFPVFLFCMGASIPLSVSKTTREWEAKYSLELDFYPSFDFNGLKNKEFLIDIGKLLFRSKIKCRFFLTYL